MNTNCNTISYILDDEEFDGIVQFVRPTKKQEARRPRGYTVHWIYRS